MAANRKHPDSRPATIGPRGRRLLAAWRECFLGAAALLAAGGLAIRPGSGRDAFAVAYLALLALVGIGLGRLWPRHRFPATRLFEGGLIGVLLLHLAVGRTGGVFSPLWPGYLVLIPLTAFGPMKVRVAGGLLAVTLALEGLGLRLVAPVGSGADPVAAFLGLAGGLLLATLGVGWISHRHHARHAGISEAYEELRDGGKRLMQEGLGDSGRAHALGREAMEELQVGASLQYQDRLDGFLTLALTALEAEACGLFEPDRGGDHLVLVRLAVRRPESDGSGETKTGKPTEPVRIPINQGHVGRAFTSVHPLVLGKLGPRDNLSVMRPTVPASSLAAVPVDAMGVTTGVLVAESHRPDAFRDRHELLVELAGQMAEARLVSRDKARREKFRRLYADLSRVSKTLSTRLTQEEILRTLLEETAGTIGYRVGAFFRVIGDSRVKLETARGLDQAAVGATYAVNRCLLGMVLANRQPLRLGDVRGDRGTATVVTGLPLECRSLAILPVATEEGRPAGVFLAADPSPDFFDSTSFAILESLANQVGYQLANAALHEKMAQMAVTDGLTGLANHRHFHERLGEELTRVKRHREPLSVILLDIDHFKKVNDTYGHPFGDIVLKGVAALLRKVKRESDLMARYGGEEMALLLPATDRRGAERMAQRVLKGLRETRYPFRDTEVAVTASLGSATYPEDGATTEALVRAADLALYHSKHAGRNRSTAAADLPESAS